MTKEAAKAVDFPQPRAKIYWSRNASADSVTMRNIFLSYSRKDAAVAEIVASELKKLGYRAFVDADRQPGQDFRKEVKAAVTKADAVLVVISSPHAAANSWIGYEVGMAEALDKPVLTLASNQFSVGDLPADVSSRQIVNFDPQSPERAAREIVERLEPA